ncbi:MAG: transporter substrate-binding domain-containing protein [Alphaproteobacteria bacterium]
MKPGYTILASVIVSVIVTYGVLKFTTPHTAVAEESVYERVMRTGVIRCGYFPSPDFLDIDPNTKNMSGLVYDYVNQLAQNLKLKVEWTEEIGRGDFIPALDVGRFDAYCTALTINSERARSVDFVSPYLFDTFNLYVREDDVRFDQNIMAANDPAIKIAAKEGDIMEKIARKHFPLAQIVQLAQMSAEVDPLLDVASNKADVVITTPKIAGRYIQNNPGKIRKTRTEGPLMYANTSLGIKAGEYRFVRMLDLAAMEMKANGQAQAIIEKYDPGAKIFLRAAKPYEAQ